MTTRIHKTEEKTTFFRWDSEGWQLLDRCSSCHLPNQAIETPCVIHSCV